MFADTIQMKCSNFGKRLLAVASTTGVALALLSCGASNTVDYLYVTSNKQNPGQINVYRVDSESGGLQQIPDSPYPSGGRNPVYEVTSPNGEYLYVANHDDNTIVKFAVGTDGKLYPQQTVNTPGTEPVALAMDPSGAALYVLDYYAPAAPGQPSYTDLNPGPGAVVVLPLDTTTGGIGSALSVGATNYWSVQCFPSNLSITANGGYLYVTNTNAVVVTTAPPVTGTVPVLPASCPSSGTVSGFSVNGGGSKSITGLTELSGSPYSTGTGSAPTGIVTDPDNSAVYVTDSAQNVVYTYSIQSGGPLALAATAATGTMPMAATVVANSKASTKFLYVANYTGGSVSIFSLNSGNPSFVASTTSGASGPTCLMVDPNLQRFLYTSNYIGGTVGGGQLNPSTGNMIQNQGSPYGTAGQPTCVAAVVHAGNTSGQ